MKYRKKPVIIDADQWFINGDHPQDACHTVYGPKPFLSEGKIVKYFRRPDIDVSIVCEKCGKAMNKHGWIDTFEGGHIVCPGDWIIKGIQGEFYPCKPDIFEKTYEKVSE